MATIAEIQQLYIIYLGRPADPNGLDFWLSKPLNALQIANAFGSTPEYQQRLADLGIAGAINQIYLNVFGRSAEPAGLQFWTQKVQTGQLSLETAGFIITNSAAGADITVRDNKQASAALYTADLRTSTQSILAYTTASGLSSGVSFLTGITTTAATPAQTQAAVNTMTTNAGGGSGGLTFNAIAANAVLTGVANTNQAGTGPGFTPSASTLTNANDLIRIGVFAGATIQDPNSTDNDTLQLDAAGFAQSAAAVVGVENIVMNGAATFGVAQIGGVRAVRFLQGGDFSAGATISTATFALGTTQAISIGTAGGTLSAFDATLSANAGILSLVGTTAVNITNLASGNSFTVSQGGAGGSLNFNAGTANTAYTLTLAGAGAYTAGGTLSAAGDFNLISVANLSKFFGNQTAGNVFSFANATGFNTYTIQSDAAANEAISASFFSGLNSLVRNTTANGVGSTFSANFNLKANTFSIGFFTASLTQNALGTGITLGVTDLALRAANAGTAANETVVLTLNASGTANGIGGGFSIDSGLTILANGIAGTAAIASQAFNALSLNVVNNASALSLRNPVSYTQNGGGAVILDTITTFNLNTTGVVSAVFTQGAFGYSSLMTFGFSQADGGVTFIYGSGLSAGSAVSLFLGSGNDIVTFINADVAAVSAAAANASAIANTSFNLIDLTDGGNDTISIFRGQQAGGLNSAATLNRMIGFGVGDVLTFTQTTFAGGLQTVARNAAWAVNTVNLYFDGTDTYVGVISGANGGNAQFANLATMQGSALIAKLAGADYSDVTRWSLVNNSMRLVA